MYNLLAGESSVLTVFIVIAVVAVVLLSLSIRVVRQGYIVVVERFGKRFGNL